MLKPFPLVVLDVQDAIDQPVWRDKNNPDYIEVIQNLLVHWRRHNWPVVHVKHNESSAISTYHTHGPWNEIKSEVAPLVGEMVVVKKQNCAFIHTELDAVLKKLNAITFVLTGVVLHNSIDATARTGKALGYWIILPSDATTAVPVTAVDGRTWEATTVYQLTLAILGNEYVEITTSAELLALLYDDVQAV